MPKPLITELFPPDTPRPSVSVYLGDVRTQLRRLKTGSVQAVVTSPPYYGLRDYQTPPQIWGGDSDNCEHQFGEERIISQSHQKNLAACGDVYAPRKNPRNPLAGDYAFTASTGATCSLCGAWRGSLGLEPTPEMFIDHLVEIFCGVWRVLRDDGVLFLNLGDSYARSGGTDKHVSKSASVGNTIRSMELRADRTQQLPTGLKSKDLIGIPWQTALALRDAGWYLRADNIWAKASSGQRDFVAHVEQTAFDLGIPNEYIHQLVTALDLPVGTCMPQSVDDRTTTAHEYVFMLTKSEHYFYDHEAVKEQSSVRQASRQRVDRFGGNKHRGGTTKHSDGSIYAGGASRNLRSVWTINPKPYRGAHSATFPPDLPRLCIKAGVSEHGCCASCSAPYERIIEKGAPLVGQQAACGASADGGYHGEAQKAYEGSGAQDPSATKARILSGMREHVTVGWKKTCSCDTNHVVPCAVLDLFAGSGTTLAEAHALGHAAIGIDLDTRNLPLIEERIHAVDQHSEITVHD